jgi:transcription elongation factor GreB
MSRYRPPAKPMSAYITPEGKTRLKDELHHLWKVERPEVTQQVSDAAALGDRSENAEYIYGKKRLREIDRRVRFLRKRLEVLNVVDQLPTDTNKVYFGAWVELTREDGIEVKYRLVGPDEIDPAKNHISIDSILGKALLGKHLDDEVAVQTPSGTHRYEVIAVNYSGAQSDDKDF